MYKTVCHPIVKGKQEQLKSFVWEEYFGIVFLKLAKHSLSMYPCGHTAAVLLPTERACTHQTSCRSKSLGHREMALSMCICVCAFVCISMQCWSQSLLRATLLSSENLPIVSLSGTLSSKVSAGVRLMNIYLLSYLPTVETFITMSFQVD